MLVRTAFMLKPLEARGKKTFSHAAARGFVMYRVKKILFSSQPMGQYCKNVKSQQHFAQEHDCVTEILRNSAIKEIA